MSSPDEAITTSSPALLDDLKQYKELMRRVVTELQIQLEEDQEAKHRLLDILQLSGPS